MKPHICYLLEDPPLSGPLNMAVDEVLLESVGLIGHPVLRFYTWSEPTLSLGYFQSSEDRSLHASSIDRPLVRRATGGGAILHDHELTYSFIWPSRRPPAELEFDGEKGGEKGTEWMYRWIHQALIDVLGTLGVPASFASESSGQSDSFLCFERRSHWDIVVGAMKVLGSAQRSRQQGLLQHGSLLLSASPLTPQLEGLCERGLNVTHQHVSQLWAARIAATAGFTVESLKLDGAQQQAVERLAADKYGNQNWTKKR
ncbi:MAG: hypothetical protein P8K78_04635 [Pirellulales bacterium]|nr:hypothetical protein [Pirellulales bacterium]